MSYVEATGVGATMTVPAGVSSGAALYLWTVESSNVSDNAPTGMSYRDFYSFDAGDGVDFAQYEPFTHDGRTSYEFTDTATQYHAVFANGAADVAGHALTEFGNDLRGIYGGWAYGYQGEATRRGGDDPASSDPMVWDFFGNPVQTPTSRWLLLAAWCALDQANDAVLLGVDVVPMLTNTSLLPGDPEADWNIDYTKAWPGNQSSGTDLEWVTQAWIVNVVGVPKLRQRQRDDLRQRQADSRQLTARQRGYF